MGRQYRDHVLDMIHLLLEILQALQPSTLEMFLVSIHMVSNVVILSPHGYFGQANVLGKHNKISMDR